MRCRSWWAISPIPRSAPLQGMQGRQPRQFVDRWQALEYITSQNFERRALDLFDVVTVVLVRLARGGPRRYSRAAVSVNTVAEVPT